MSQMIGIKVFIYISSHLLQKTTTLHFSHYKHKDRAMHYKSNIWTTIFVTQVHTAFSELD